MDDLLNQFDHEPPEDLGETELEPEAELEDFDDDSLLPDDAPEVADMSDPPDAWHEDGVEHRVVCGDPGREEAHWGLQKDLTTCATTVQKCVLEAVLGVDFDESELQTMAVEKGWADPERGTPNENLGNLLEAHGVEVDRGYDRTLTDLLDALERDEKVIVALDGNEIWEPRTGPGGAPLELRDHGHTVWVTGMEVDDDGRVTIVVNDPAHEDGRSKSIGVEHFLNAWVDFGNYAVVARKS